VGREEIWEIYFDSILIYGIGLMEEDKGVWNCVLTADFVRWIG